MENDKSNKKEIMEKLTIGLLIATIFIMIFNVVNVGKLKNIETSSEIPKLNTNIQTVKSVPSIDVLPKGIPKIYGSELGVKYDDVSGSNLQKAEDTIGRLGTLDKEISLSGEDKNRYISIASRISCEYCCGTDSIIFASGEPACGCSHSFAMRGIAKYLIKYHGKEFSDDGILEEMGKWKTLFFPDKLSQKAGILKSNGIELNYINLASNKYRDIEKGAENSNSQMVGGC